jgi:hypothetical protein
MYGFTFCRYSSGRFSQESNLYTFFVNIFSKEIRFPGGGIVPLVGLVNIAKGDLRGAHLGLVNWATEDFAGLQMGGINTDTNYTIAKRLAADGDRVKMLPVYRVMNWKNPDYLINASLWELESPNGSQSSVDHAIRNGQDQAPNLIMQVPKTANRSQVLRTIYNRFTRKDSPARIRNLILLLGDERSGWTADQIRGWTIPG